MENAMDQTSTVMDSSADQTARQEPNKVNDSVNPAKTFTQDEVNKLITDRLSKEREKFNVTLEEKLSEAQKLAKMNADQKAQYEREQAEAKLAQREAEITKRELKATAKDTLLSKGLPIELADALVYTDADACNASMEAVTKAFEQAVTRAVNDRLRQDPPKAGNPNQDDFVAALRNAAGLTNKT